jgi:hypothetical protein
MPLSGNGMSPIPQAVAVCAAAAALLLLSKSSLQTGCWVVLLPVAAVAWPLWSYQREQVLFGRRLVLTAVAAPGSRVKALLWSGTLSTLFRVPAALALAALLLAMSSQLRWSEWAVLAVDAALLICLTPAIHRLLSGEIVPAHLGAVTRRWPTVLANTLLLTLAFTAHDYWAGVPDSRNQSWSELIDRAVHAGTAAAKCDAAGWLLGVINLAEQLPRHAAMLTLPGLTDPLSRTAAWFVFLGVTGCGGYLFTRFLLGTQSIAELWHLPASSPLPSDRGDGLFVAAAAALLAAVLLLASHSADFDWWSRLKGAPGDVAKRFDPCGSKLAQTRALQANAHRELDDSARADVDEAMRHVDAHLSAAFDVANKGVDAYLDWYFSFVGSYTRLGAVVIPGLNERIQAEFTRKVIEDTAFSKKVEQLAKEAEDRVLERIAGRTEEIGRVLSAQLEREPCAGEVIRSAPLKRLSRDAVRSSLSAAVAVPLSRIVLNLAGRAANEVLARAVARQSMKAAASAAGSTTAKRTTAVVMSAGAAAVVCAPGGLLAAGCSALAGVIAWLGVDVALIAIDEALFREKMKQETIAELAQQQTTLRESIRLQLEQTVNLYRIQARNAVDAVFVPARDG